MHIVTFHTFLFQITSNLKSGIVLPKIAKGHSPRHEASPPKQDKQLVHDLHFIPTLTLGWI